jgi:hypothetical protein
MRASQSVVNVKLNNTYKIFIFVHGTNELSRMRTYRIEMRADDWRDYSMEDASQGMGGLRNKHN